MQGSQSAVLHAGRRIPFLDALRVLCTYGVILGHLSTWSIDALPVGCAAWTACNLYNCLLRCCVPMFLMVSGYLALDCPTYEDAVRRQTKGLGRFIPVYVVWSLFYAALSLAQGFKAGTPDFARFFSDWIIGEFHLWYLAMLCGVYLVLPLLFLVTRDAAPTRLFVGVAFVSTILLPSLLGCFAPLAPFVTLLKDSYLDTGFLFYFVAGYALRRHPLPEKIGRWLWLPALATAGLCALLTAQLSAKADGYALYWLDQRGLLTALVALGFFITAQSFAPVFAKHPLPAGLSGLTLGIYAVHIFFILVLEKLGFTPLRFAPVWWLPVLAALVFCLSAGAAFLFKKLPVFKRLV